MVTFGGDCHKKTHTVVAVDENGRQLGERTVAATPSGHMEALSWARQWSQRQWALENCRHLSRVLERNLLNAGEAVVQVSPKLMGGARRSGRELGKSDPIDALAVARAALREPRLPVAQLEGKEREVKLLVDHREDLVGERTRIQNRLLWHLHEVEPGYQVVASGLLRAVVLAEVRTRLENHSGVVAEIALELVDRLAELTRSIKRLQRRIEVLMHELAPSLLSLAGCAGLSAAKLVAETADVSRFRSSAAFAMHNGTAPIPVWSGNHERHRLNRGGNRQLNVVLHRIAITQMRVGGQASDYIARRLSMGNSKTEAIRALRRQISDEVYRRLRQDHSRRSTALMAVAA
ncbi:MAG: IS110 family transposase [Chloroflexi bacterium]|nr:MAG: IS110 family transposase [Chloroflexota bacterium]TMF96463.1 MAG: IS110 family transposase [Chloroflexota bacterium]